MRKQLLAFVAAVTAGLGLALSAPTAAQAADVPSLGSCSDQLMVVGSHSDCVTSLQHSLGALGFTLDEDGWYGARTRLAVAYYQSWARIPSDGMAGSETVTNLDRDANRPAPADRGSIPAMPDKGATFSPTGGGVQTCGTASCSSYFGRTATKQLNDKLNEPNVNLSSGEAATAFCGAVGVAWGPGGKFAGPLCGQAVAIEIYQIQRATDEAVKSGSCFEIKSHIFPTQYVEFMTNNGHNCIP